MFIFLIDNCIICVHLAIVFTFLPLSQFCCCVKLEPLPQIAGYEQNVPFMWNRLKPQVRNISDPGPHMFSISLSVVGFLLRIEFSLSDTETTLRHYIFLSVTTRICIGTELGSLTVLVLSNSCKQAIEI